MDSTAVVATIQLGVAAFLIALTGAMMPGPVLTVTIEHTVTRGRGPAMLLMVGHALLEAFLLIGLAFGLQRVLLLPLVTALLGIVGGVFLLWMGGSMLFGAVRGRLHLDLEAETTRASRLGPVARGAALSLGNPYWVIWWATVGLALASKAIAIGPFAVLVFFVGHEAADFAWYGAVILAVSSGRRFMSDRAYRTILSVCAIFLLFLGVRFGLAGLGALRA